MAALLGLVAALAGQKRQPLLGMAVAVVVVLLVVTAALGMVVGKSAPGWLPAALVTAVGLLAVSGVSPAPWLVWLATACAGFAAGVAADLDTLTWQPVAGACGTLGLMLVVLLAGCEDLYGVARLQKVLPIARRVLGSWVAALGLLLGALAMRPA